MINIIANNTIIHSGVIRMKNCPYCRTVLNDNAVQCHVCGYVYQQQYYQQYTQYQQSQSQHTQSGYQQPNTQQQYYQQPNSFQHGQAQNNQAYSTYTYYPQRQYEQSTIEECNIINNLTTAETESTNNSNRSGFNWIRLISIIIFIAIGVLIINSTGLLSGIGNLFTGSSFDVAVNEDFYVSCAKTLISKRLKSPSTAIWYNEKVVDQDEYGRVLVTMTVEAQNGFGGYGKLYYAVVIYDCNPSDGTFKYNRLHSVQMCETEEFFDNTIELAKSLSNWGEPLETNSETE